MEIVVDAGATTRTWEIAATAAGRRVEVSSGRGMVTVTEVTRGGTPVRTAQFMANRVLALNNAALAANVACALAKFSIE